MGEACRTIRRSDSNEEDWRMPHGKRPSAVEINKTFNIAKKIQMKRGNEKWEKHLLSDVEE